MALAVMAGSCGKREEAGIQRLAILRFENLTPDASTDWIGRALPEVMVAELSGAPGIYAIPSSRLHAQAAVFGARPTAAPGISAEEQLAESLGANRIGYGEYSIVNGRLRARLTIEDPARRKVASGPIEVAVGANQVVEAASAMARQISPAIRPYATSNAAALAAYARGIEATDLGAARRYADEAIARDPNFGPGYLMLADTAMKQQDRAGAMAALESAAARGSQLQEWSRLRVEMLAATLRGNAEAGERSLTALAQSAPLDPTLWRSLAETAGARRRYAQSMAAYERALAIEPEDAALWNELGYVAAYAGKFDAGLNALKRYQALRPSDPNPLDSMGDVNMLAGRLKEAEGLYLEAYKKNPAFLNGIDLYKAATARLMTGDVAGANGISGEKADTPDWLWLTGKRREAVERLAGEAAKSSNREAQGRAYAQLAIWALLLKDRAAAARFVALGVPLATPPTAGALALSRLAAMPSGAAGEWVERANQIFPNAPPNSVKDLALAYALLLDGHFTEAAPLLRGLEGRLASNGDRGLAVDLAWALVETGKVEEAAPLLQLTPILAADAARPYLGLYFPRVFQLRAMVAERAGRQDEARENRRIYAALGGK